MKEVWKRIKKWIFPDWRLALLLAVLSGAALTYIFANGREEEVYASAVYTLSAYSLVAVIPPVLAAIKAVRSMLYQNAVANRYLSDVYFRVRTGFVFSLFMNLCYAGMRMVYAVIGRSLWDGALAVYYALLCGIRMYLLNQFPADGGGKTRGQELIAYRATGRMLFALDVALGGVFVPMVRDGNGYHYPGVFIYAVAAHSFYCLTMAIINTIRFRKFDSPVLSATKVISLTTALVSIFSLETALLSAFGTGEASEKTMTALTAAGVCIIILVLAIGMLIQAEKQLKNLPDA